MRFFLAKEHTEYIPSFQTTLIHGATLSFFRGRPHTGYLGLRNTGAIEVELLGGEPGGRAAA